jgi:ABC-type phosphate/phosphonate transport system substrate-binding protein
LAADDPGAQLMVTARIAVLPMYDFPPLREAHDELWAALRQRLVAAGVERVPLQLSHVTDHVASWLHPELLLGQACEYPLAVRIAGQVRMVATPRYTAEVCTGACYRSAIIVRTADPAGTLLDLRGRRCAYNEADSNSGMNLLRAAIAPLARGARFFASVDASGSHLASASQVADGRADAAAIDCVSLAHFRRQYPALTAQLRVLAWTQASPSLPLITADTTDAATLSCLRAALADVARDPALRATRDELLLDGFDCAPDISLRKVRELAQLAVDSGYPRLW